MNKKEIDYLVDQIRDIILNKPISQNENSSSEELADLQEAINYLSNCLSESNEFLRDLSRGNLEVKPPSRHNFLVGSLKELHSGLKSLTWQANQVANGDYNQHVNFLGDFSDSFNKMIEQLSEREAQLKHQSYVLSETASLMRSIMDGLKDWVVVISKEKCEIIYTNMSARQHFYNIETERSVCGRSCQFMDHLRKYNAEEDHDQSTYEYTCPSTNKTFNVRCFLIEWNDTPAYVHYIVDVTTMRKYQEQIEGLAYTDDLTGLYNRRYCIESLNFLLQNKTDFSFCIIDLDGLKFVNDHFGHLAGDAYIRTVVKEIQANSDSKDISCRIGGDEFALLFLNCSASAILAKMENLDARLTHLSTDYPMSVSYGIVHVSPGDTITSEIILSNADEKMYTLKKAKKIALSGSKLK